MKKWIVLFFVLVLSVMVAACGKEEATAKEKGLSDLVTYFKEKGFDIGEKSEKSFQMIGAIDGFEITIDDQQVELYQFDPKQSNPTLEKVKSEGKFADKNASVNGNFMIVEYNGPDLEKIDKTFKEFK